MRRSPILRKPEGSTHLHQQHGGIGSMLMNGGHLHLDLGDIERAALEGAKAYNLAHSKHDLIVMARARILEAYTENARVEEEWGEDANIASHAHQARRYAEEVVRLALQMQNRQVLAGAHIVSGMVAASDFFKEWEEARRCEMESAALLRSYDRDHLSEELAVLKLRVMRSIGTAHQLTLVVKALLRPPLGLEKPARSGGGQRGVEPAYARIHAQTS
jgi:hypothetical protein